MVLNCKGEREGKGGFAVWIPAPTLCERHHIQQRLYTRSVHLESVLTVLSMGEVHYYTHGLWLWLVLKAENKPVSKGVQQEAVNLELAIK